jgi:hypothetical protein
VFGAWGTFQRIENTVGSTSRPKRRGLLSGWRGERRSGWKRARRPRNGEYAKVVDPSVVVERLTAAGRSTSVEAISADDVRGYLEHVLAERRRRPCHSETPRPMHSTDTSASAGHTLMHLSRGSGWV